MRELITDLEKHVQLYKDLTSEHHLDFMKWLNRTKFGSLSGMPEHICEAFILWAERAQPDHNEPRRYAERAVFAQGRRFEDDPRFFANQGLILSLFLPITRYNLFSVLKVSLRYLWASYNMMDMWWKA